MAADFEQCFVRQYVQQVERCGSAEGAAAWYADQARGNYAWLAEMWRLCVNPVALQRWNLLLLPGKNMPEAEVMEQ
eukprot:1846530-Amphidinium_carterae.1